MDRFHLSTQVFQASAGRRIDFGWLEDRLRPLGFAVVLCVRDPDTFAEARLERLAISAKPDQYDDLSVFRSEQERLRAAAAASTLPVLELQVAGRSVAELADGVADWLTDRNLLGTPVTSTN